jgi:hypothetical protein
LTPYSLGEAYGAIEPNLADITTGPTGLVFIDLYTGFPEPTDFGGGGANGANSGSGDTVTIIGAFPSLIGVPEGYVSDGALSDSSTYDNQPFSSLGATPGVHRWSWGSGANQNFTVVIGEVPVNLGHDAARLRGPRLGRISAEDRPASLNAAQTRARAQQRPAPEASA